jgi:hypothetical protein
MYSRSGCKSLVVFPSENSIAWQHFIPAKPVLRECEIWKTGTLSVNAES